MCEHSISMLMGTADGIVCRNCGATFKSFEEIPKAVKEEEAPKKTTTKRGKAAK